MLLTLDLQTFAVLGLTMATPGLDISTLAISSHAEKGQTHHERIHNSGERANYLHGPAISGEMKQPLEWT